MKRFMFAFTVAFVLIAGCTPVLTPAPLSPTPTATPVLPTPTATPIPTATQVMPKPGKYTSSAEFGEFDFTVASDSTKVTVTDTVRSPKIKCPGGTVSAERLPFNDMSGTIVAGQFTVKGKGPTLMMGGDVLDMKLTLSGKFDETGTRASGTWELDCSGKISSGNWNSQ